MSFEQIRTAILERQNSIKSVRVTYDLTSEKLADDPTERDPGSAIWGTERMTFVLEGDRRYLHRTELSRKSPDCIASFDGSETLKLRSGSAIVAEEKLPECEDGELYCDMILQIPYRDRDKVNRAINWLLPYVLDLHKEKYTLRSKQELIDGAWCDVIEAENNDIIWVDAKLGYAWRKRVIYGSFDASRGVARKQLEYNLGNFTEGAPGIWVPKTATIIRFGRQKKDEPEIPMEAWKMNVLEVSLNQVQEKDFEVSIPPGTTVLKDKKSFVVKGDKGLLLSKFADIRE